MAPRTRHNKRTVKRTRKQQKRKEIKKNKTSVSNCITPQISLFIIGQVSKLGSRRGGGNVTLQSKSGEGHLTTPNDRSTYSSTWGGFGHKVVSLGYNKAPLSEIAPSQTGSSLRQAGTNLP